MVVASSVSASAVAALGLIAFLLYCVRGRAKVNNDDDDVVIEYDGSEIKSSDEGEGSEKSGKTRSEAVLDGSSE